MNTYITQTIRFGAVLGLALFAFTSEVFAAPTLTPVQVNNITKTTAILVAKVESPYKISTVWFEWGESSSLSPMTTIGLKSIYDSGNGGFFQADLSNLKQDTTYYYRAVAMEGGTTLYSPIASFKTAGVAGTVATTVLYQNTTPTPAPAPVVVAPVVTQTTSVSSTQTKKYTAPVAKKATTKVVAKATTTKDGFTNGSTNVAATIGAGDGMLPGTLIGWITLIILLLFVVLLGIMIHESSEKRKKVRLAKKLAEEEKEMETDKVLENNR